MFFNKKPYPIVKRDRLKIFAAEQLAKWQNKFHATGSCIALLSWDIVDVNGNILRREERKSNSFTRNYYDSVCCNAVIHCATVGSTYADGSLDKKDATGGTGMSQIGACAHANATGNGIYVGTGTTAESFDDYKIETLIAAGTGSGQLDRGAPLPSMVYDSGTTKWTSYMSNLFFNMSGASITINEIVYYKGVKQDTSTGAILYICMIRDMISASPIVLDNLEGVNITYSLNYTFP